MKRLLGRTLLILIVLGAAGAGAAWYRVHAIGEQAVAFRTAPITRGDLLVTIGATGTVEPEEVVDVGAQVAGQIIEFGKDENGKPIDYGSQVEEGTVLARIDDSLYAADVAQAKAQLESAQAGLLRAQADLETMNAKLDQAQHDWTRAQSLGPSEALAQTSYDNYRATYLSAKANVEVDKASIEQAKAAISQAEAGLQRAQRNLDYCTIKMPVKGVIVDRRVNIGQTVVSSLNAPSLFLIAKDLKRMQVWVSVNEADIGNIHPGQPVTFTVDAYPGEVFQGEVGKIRLNATMTQNVVTYTVEVATDNSSGRLLPYLTANVDFELARRGGVLLVPNSALRWTPRPELLAAGEARKGATESTKPASNPATASAGRWEATPPTSSPAGKGGGSGVVWVPDGNHVRPIHVRVGLSDGTNTEAQGEGLTEGIEVVLGEEQQGAAPGEAKNPFTPQLFRQKNPSGGGKAGA